MTHAQRGDAAGAGTDDVAGQRITMSGSAARINPFPAFVSTAYDTDDYLSHWAGFIPSGTTYRARSFSVA